MNFKFKHPKKRKWRYLRRGWCGEGENRRRQQLELEFIVERRKYLESNTLLRSSRA